MPRQQGQTLQEALCLFQNLIISATKENQKGTKSHTHFITPKKPKHDPLLEKTSVYSMFQKEHQRLSETQNKPEYILYFPSQDCRCAQNKAMAFISGFYFCFIKTKSELSFNFLSACFPEIESIFLTK